MISENQKRAMKTAIDYYTNPTFRNWYAVAHTNKYKEGNKIVFSNQTETGAMYFKVMNHRKMLYIGMIYSDKIVNNYECKAFSLCADARYLRKTDPSAAGYASAYIYPLNKDAAYDYMNDEYRIDETGYIMLKI